MQYISTRGASKPVDFQQAIVQGLASDGGLLLPTELPQISADQRAAFGELSYAQIAAAVLHQFGGFPRAQWEEITAAAYGTQWKKTVIAPLRKLSDELFVLEQFWGPTAAFKDFALQLLPQLLARTECKSQRLVLVATSGDTGGAALAGFANTPRTKVACFFPTGMVSPLQQRQMQAAAGDNLATIEVSGDFDNMQQILKDLFADDPFKNELSENFDAHLTSANSINIGRLLPQVVYYFALHAQLVADGTIKIDQRVDVCVPTGNVGNICGGLLAKQMGCPIGKLIVANNANNTTAELIRTGVFDLREHTAHCTLSPAMDIVRGSNLERLLYLLTGRDSAKVARWQQQLKEEGHFELDQKTLAALQTNVASYAVDDPTTSARIASTVAEHDYLPCPHTAVGLEAAAHWQRDRNTTRPLIVASTAHYGKFGDTVFDALFPDTARPTSDTSTLTALAAAVPHPQLPADLPATFAQPLRHQHKLDAKEVTIKAFLRDFLQNN